MNVVVLAIALLLIAVTLLATVTPVNLARGLKTGGPFILIGLGLLLTMLRQPAIGGALIMGGMALRRYLASRQPVSPSTGGNRHSTVRTAALDMELNHETGEMEGVVLAGRYEGRALHDLNRENLLDLRTQVRDDADSMALLDAYLDRRFTGWREDAEPDGSAGQAGPAGTGAMSEEEAYEVLGLSQTADAAAIRAAHRRLMKDLHPDRGGSTFLAAKINEAKDTLLGRHS